VHCCPPAGPHPPGLSLAAQGTRICTLPFSQKRLHNNPKVFPSFSTRKGENSLADKWNLLTMVCLRILPPH